MKKCRKCGQEKSLEEFRKESRFKDGYATLCKTCGREDDKVKRSRNQPKRNAYNRQYRKDHPDTIQENWESYYEKNKDRLKTIQKQKYRSNPIKHLLYAAKQRSEVFGVPFDLKEADLVLPAVCPVLGIPLVIGGESKHDSPSIDRIKPELGYVKGNVAIMSLRANQMKGTSTLSELKSLVSFLDKFEKPVLQ